MIMNKNILLQKCYPVIAAKIMCVGIWIHIERWIKKTGVKCLQWLSLHFFLYFPNYCMRMYYFYNKNYNRANQPH